MKISRLRAPHGCRWGHAPFFLRSHLCSFLWQVHNSVWTKLWRECLKTEHFLNLFILFIIIIIFFLLHLRYLLHYICVVSHGTQREWKGKKFNTIIFCIKLFFPYCVLLFLVFICLTHNSFMFQYTVNRRIIWPYRFIAYIRSSHWSWIEVI